MTQGEATSKDGTKIPYFVVMREGTKRDGRNPTMLYGYGGFEISLTPSYSGTIGAAWLERGGVWVLANIRGGGEFGPAWHQAALRENRQRVLRRLHRRGRGPDRSAASRRPRTSASWAAATAACSWARRSSQRPELFNAVVCQVPLLDMKRYNKLLAGASWMGEYGNPDDPGRLGLHLEVLAVPERAARTRNIRASSSPPRRATTACIPGHARKMAAR